MNLYSVIYIDWGNGDFGQRVKGDEPRAKLLAIRHQPNDQPAEPKDPLDLKTKLGLNGQPLGPPGIFTRPKVSFRPRGEGNLVVFHDHMGQGQGKGRWATHHFALIVVL